MQSGHIEVKRYQYMEDPQYVIVTSETQKEVLLQTLERQHFSIDYVTDADENDPHGIIYCIDPKQHIAICISGSTVLEDSEKKVISVHRYLDQEYAVQIKKDIRIHICGQSILFKENDMLLLNRAGDILDIYTSNRDISNVSLTMPVEIGEGQMELYGKDVVEVENNLFHEAQAKIVCEYGMEEISV